MWGRIGLAARARVGLAAVLLAALTGCGSAVSASAPSEPSYRVGVRTLALSRDAERPLPTTIWYPAAGVKPPTDDPGGAVPGAPVAAGRFPIVLFSHGLHSLPEQHAQLTVRWAAAGFVVAAPAYPHSRLGAARFDRADVRQQPADAWYVVRRVAALDLALGDPFAGHLDPSRIAAVGHSAGGYTTAGLFTAGHSRALRGGIVIAGGMRDRFGGPAARMLFVHGSADPIVPAARGHAAYLQVRWPKAFLTVVGQGHGEYLRPGATGFEPVVDAMTDFLRWVLLEHTSARERLPLCEVPGITTWSGRI